MNKCIKYEKTKIYCTQSFSTFHVYYILVVIIFDPYVFISQILNFSFVYLHLVFTRRFLKRSLLGVFLLPYLMLEVTQTLTKNDKWANKEVNLVVFFF